MLVSNMRIEHIIAAKNHAHSVKNPYSQFRNGWTVDQVLQAPKITTQLTKFMCSPTSVSVISFSNAQFEFSLCPRMGQPVVLLHQKTLCMLTDWRTKLSK